MESGKSVKVNSAFAVLCFALSDDHLGKVLLLNFSMEENRKSVCRMTQEVLVKCSKIGS